MELRDYVRVLRKRWAVVAACIAVGLSLASVVVVSATPRYEATAQLFVSANDTGGLATDLQQGAQFSQDRVQSYAQIINSRQITDAVASSLAVGLSGKQISDEVSADAPINTVLVNVHVTDTSARRAQLLANAVSSEFASYAANLEASSSGSKPPVKVTVVKQAALPTSPVSPKKPLDLGLGLLVGLVAGMAGAFTREALDNTVKTAEDVQRATGKTAIGVIAFDPDAKSHPLVVVEDLHGTRAEAFRQLRTNLQFVDVDTPLRSIVCTSSVPGEGKTTTICNLAITLAHTGLRVLLMEADLRRPRVGIYMGLENAVGLTSVLIGAVSFDDAVQHWGPDGLLDVLPSGPTPPNPSELLGSRGMADLLHSLEDRYDIVLLDAPPLLPVTDAAVLAVETTGAIVVVHHGKTRREQLENSAQAIAAVGARILGTVLNFAPRKGPEAYYYGYGYSYRQTEKKPGLRPARLSRTTTEPAAGTLNQMPVSPATGVAPSGSDRDRSETASATSPIRAWPDAPALPDGPAERSTHADEPAPASPESDPAAAQPTPSSVQAAGDSGRWPVEEADQPNGTPPLIPYSAHRTNPESS